jgi:GAF domain-containing protein
VPQVVGVEFCNVFELLPHGALVLRAGAGWKEGLVGRATVHGGRDSQAGFTLLSNAPVIAENLSTETRFKSPPLLLDHGVVSGMSVIIHARGRPYGVLGGDTTKQRKFTSEDVHFLQSVANVLAAAIERRQLEEEHERVDFLRRSLVGKGRVKTVRKVALAL